MEPGTSAAADSALHLGFGNFVGKILGLVWVMKPILGFVPKKSSLKTALTGHLLHQDICVTVLEI